MVLADVKSLVVQAIMIYREELVCICSMYVSRNSYLSDDGYRSSLIILDIILK
jgi:hypothetical protein